MRFCRENHILHFSWTDHQFMFCQPTGYNFQFFICGFDHFRPASPEQLLSFVTSSAYIRNSHFLSRKRFDLRLRKSRRKEGLRWNPERSLTSVPSELSACSRAHRFQRLCTRINLLRIYTHTVAQTYC